MSQDDVREVTEQAKTNKKRRFDARDFNTIAEYVTDTLASRKRARKDLEKQWKEIDRQISMEPDISHKLDSRGRPDPRKQWMPELELPLQAQTLEILTADARRMTFPDAGSWFEAHAALTDDYLDRVDFQGLIAGDQNEVPTQIDQDAADKLTSGVLNHWHRQYDFFGNCDQINAEAFKYGMGVGRGRVVTKRVFMNTAKGVVPVRQQIPVLFPVSIKNTYPDDSAHNLMNEGQWIGPSTVREFTRYLSDVIIAANKGSKDPENEDGGWMPKNLVGIDPEKDGTVRIVEMEGDFIVTRKTTSDMYIPNAVATILIGKRGRKSVHQVIRFRFRKDPFPSYIQFPYHSEHLDNIYPSSPLLKGRPIQMTAVNALTRMMEAGALNTQPPVQYDKDDPTYASEGGPNIAPGESIPSTGDVNPLFIGDAGALFQIYAGLLQQYSDVTGITAPRLGQQTVSHTTAFAKEAELQRGTVRTVDYVRSTLKGPMTQWLHMAFEMGKRTMKQTTLYIDAYNGFVTIDKDALPDDVTFEAHGSGGPQEEAAKNQQKQQAMQLALQLDTTNAQMGGEPTIDIPKMIDQVLREGGWTDVDQFLRAQGQLSQQSQPSAGAAGILTQGVQQ